MAPGDQLNSDSRKTLPRYQYTCLPGPHSIRLLEITSSLKDCPTIEANIVITNPEEPDHPPYFALSYAWKASEDADEDLESPNTPALIVDKQRLAIGSNVHNFLEQIMTLPDDPNDPDDCHLLWIDAICIDQENLAERSAQVAFMRTIYENAYAVIIWLGKHDEHSRRAMQLIAAFADVQELGDGDMEKLVPRPLKDTTFFTQHGMTPWSLADWEAVRLLHSRAWFTRLWTVQELIVAKEAFILCGDTILDWSHLACFLQVAHVQGWALTLYQEQYAKSSIRRPVFGGDTILGMTAMYHVKYESNPEFNSVNHMLQQLFNYVDRDGFSAAKLSWIIQSGRLRKATDHRDRVFAPLGLAFRTEGGDLSLMTPDYTTSVEHVFTHITRSIMLNLKNLSFLSCVEDKCYRTLSKLPSWVPDFSSALRPTPLSTQVFYLGLGKIEAFYNASKKIEAFYNASRKTEGLIVLFESSFVFIDDGLSLAILGVRVASIHGISEDCETLLLQRFSRMMAVISCMPTKYHSGESRGEVLMKTLVAGVANSSLFHERNGLESFNDLRVPYTHFLKYHLAFERWQWNRNPRNGERDWWDDHQGLETLLDQDKLFPSRSELDAFLEYFSSYMPSSQDFNAKPIIDDPSFIEHIWNPQVPYYTNLVFSCAARSLFITEESFVGLAPKSVRQRDEVWIVHGSKTPFLLRPRSDGAYAFLGEAYIHGFMYGEYFDFNPTAALQRVVLK